MSAPEPEPEQRAFLSRRRAWLVAVMATLAMSVSYIDRQVLAALAQSVRAALDIDHEQFGWLASAFSMSYLVATPLAGVVIDRVGARAGLVGAMVVWSAVAAAHALVPSYGVLFALRIALGTAEAPSFPSAAQAVRRALPARERSAGIGLLFTGSSIGAMIAAPLAIAMKKSLGGWQPAFIGTAMVGLVWIPFWLLATRGAAARRALATVEAPHASAPLTRADMLRDPAALRAIVIVFLTAPAMAFVLLWAPQYLEHAFNVEENDLGKYLWMPALFFDVGAVAMGWIASRRDRRAGARDVSSHADLMIIAALAAGAIAFAPFARTPWAAVALASVSLAGVGGVFARATADVLARVNPAHVSTASGMTAAAQSLAYIVASPLIGRAVDATHSFDGPLVALGVIILPGAALWALWPVRAVASHTS